MILKLDKGGSVDEAHCCDTSWSLWLMIGWHSKVTSSEQGYNSILVKQLLYRSDVSIQHTTELASLACTLRYLRNTYWVPNTHSCKMHTEVKEQGTDQTSLYYSVMLWAGCRFTGQRPHDATSATGYICTWQQTGRDNPNHTRCLSKDACLFIIAPKRNRNLTWLQKISTQSDTMYSHPFIHL